MTALTRSKSLSKSGWDQTLTKQPGNTVGGHWTPSMAAGGITEATAAAMVAVERKTLPALTQGGLTAATQQGHRRRLRAMRGMPQELAELPLPVALLAWFNMARKAKRCSWRCL